MDIQDHIKQLENRIRYLQLCYQTAIKFVNPDQYDTLFYLLDEMSIEYFKKEKLTQNLPTD